MVPIYFCWQLLPSGAHLGGPWPPRWAPEGREGGRYRQVSLYLDMLDRVDVTVLTEMAPYFPRARVSINCPLSVSLECFRLMLKPFLFIKNKNMNLCIKFRIAVQYGVLITSDILGLNNILIKKRKHSLIQIYLQYIPRNMHTVFALLCFVVVIHWLIFPYPSGLLHWHCGNLTIAPVPAKQPWWIWINTSCEFIMNDCITTTKQSRTNPCAYFLDKL